ncbi:hypothetical protein AQJ91_29360 [Streptomyces dysideae]|uniref:Uncharacterized protein n=1 Tax=Streptomyces dysideae TaxID=909626 RepID=A0A117RZH4_9ACTN|nr:hypothetical protein AQJ91_29360 [Streptomyces dysideae]
MPAPGEGPELLLRHDYLSGWMHGIGEVVTALTSTGVTIRRLRESDELLWPRWPRMERTPHGWWRPPEPRIPLLYGLPATR